MSDEKSTNCLTKDLFSLVAALQKDLTALKAKEDDHQRGKRLYEENEADANGNGKRHTDRQKHHNSDANEAESEDDVSTKRKCFKFSEEGKPFL